ncbi:MAG: hypothetical protein AB1640_20090 [bacterium]
MRPTGEQILKTLANTLVTQLMQEVTRDKAKADLGMMALLMGVACEEFERGTSQRMEENRELRELFSEALAVVRDPALRDRLREGARTSETDYSPTALDRLNAELLEVLIALHRHVETLDGHEARGMERKIWRFLEGWTRRRAFATSELFQPIVLMATLQKRSAQGRPT